MTKPTRALLDQALALPAAAREQLDRKLLESLDEESESAFDPAVAKELERRLADEPAAGERWPTVDDVLTRLRRELKLPAARATKRRGS